MASEISRSGSLVLEKDVKAELVESLENKLELDDDHLLEEDDIGRLLVGVTVNVGTESLVGLLGTSVLGETSIWMLKGNWHLEGRW